MRKEKKNVRRTNGKNGGWRLKMRGGKSEGEGARVASMVAKNGFDE